MPTSTDTYVEVQPDGSITFDFTGHVHAQGLDLDAGPNAAVPARINSVSWIDAGNGALVANVAGTHGAGAQNSLCQMNVYPEVAGESALAALLAINDAGNTAEAGIQVGRAGTKDIGSGAGVDRVHAFATQPSGFIDRTIINGSGNSDFLQLDSTQKLHLKRGTTGNNTIASFNAGAYAYVGIPTGLGAGVPIAAFVVAVPGGSMGAGQVPLGAQGIDGSGNINVWLFNQSAFNLSGGTIRLGWAVIY